MYSGGYKYVEKVFFGKREKVYAIKYFQAYMLTYTDEFCTAN